MHNIAQGIIFISVYRGNGFWIDGGSAGSSFSFLVLEDMAVFSNGGGEAGGSQIAALQKSYAPFWTWLAEVWMAENA